MRPWQIWLLFALGLAVVTPALAWLTVKALALDRAELQARRQAEQEEDLSRALWRMDSLLTPLLAEEAARPDFVYRPAYATGEPAGKKGEEPRELSPLLAAPPQFVRVHFEVHPDGRIASPQTPTGELGAWATANGARPETIAAAEKSLAELRPALCHADLLALLPEHSPLSVTDSDLPRLESPSQQAALTPNNSPETANPVIDNNYSQLKPPPEVQVAQQVGAPQLDDSTEPVSTPLNNPQGGPGSPQPPPQQQVTQQQVTQQPTAQQGLSSLQGGPGQQLLPFNFAANTENPRQQRSQTRGGNDLQNREAALQAYAQKEFNEQRSNVKAAPPPLRVVEGASRALWLGDKLLLARRVEVGGQTVVQGCWLDWDALQQRLQAEVADLLPAVELSPAPLDLLTGSERLLATIPVQLIVPAPAAEPAVWSPMRVSLVVAWSCLLLTALAAAVTLRSVLTLSERRGAFVSAVTHELRTPLTTFRMYAEMLAAGMVPDAQQRQRYLETLRTEADRLSHLVENVLQYARLERGRPGGRREETTLGGLLHRCQSRLADRAEGAELKLLVEIDEPTRDTELCTDPAAVEQILFNLVDNACKYAATASDKQIHLRLAVLPRQVRISLRDHGPGISAAGRRRLFRPFSKSVHEAASSAPGVGLGLALSRRLAHDLGGKLELQSPAEGGAEFVLTLPR
ncbi:MAG: HAMP domain-containing sensor histidine kinase [Pirellulaceae bacterium]|nr:HAMP domain-containing sensor histidine kinase [Pirellulaceae bacterium]